MSTQCGHVFCFSCIVATLNERKECPMCCKKQTIQNIRVLCLVYQIVVLYRQISFTLFFPYNFAYLLAEHIFDLASNQDNR